jgi:UDP-N-acetylmuramate--alanine ligase
MSNTPALSSLLSRHDVAVHLVGCGGAGMRALAEFVCDRGWNVTGCDAGMNERTGTKLEHAGVNVLFEHSAEHVRRPLDLLVHTPAVQPSHPEVDEARRRGIPVVSYPEFLGAVSKWRPTVAVAGTHGKSTTTALIASAMTESGGAGAVFCGAEVLSRQRHGWAGPGEWAVIEACEYRRHFLELRPKIAVVLAVEEDHLDCYPDIDQAIEAYISFVRQTSDFVVLNADSHATMQILKHADRDDLETFTLGLGADWVAEDVHFDGRVLSISLHYDGREESRLKVPIGGSHHAANVIAAYIALKAAGVSKAAISESFEGFGGLARRLEPHPLWHAVTRYDDYAHHPTALSATLWTLKQRHPRQPLVAVFQPHQLSRTARFLREFAEALSLADQAYVLPVYAAREDGGTLADQLSQEMARCVSRPCVAQFIPSLDHALVTLETALRPGDVFVTLGAGDLDCLHYELPRRFP